MREALHFAVAGLLAFSFSTVALAMGGGTYGGTYQGNFNQNAATDDYAVAQRLIRHEEFAAAIPRLEKALSKRPRNADILNYLGYAHRMVGMSQADPARDAEYKISLAYYQQALALDPNHKGVHEYLGELYLQMHDLDAAHREMNVLVSLCPEGCAERDALDKALGAYAPPAVEPSPAADTAPAVPSQ